MQVGITKLPETKNGGVGQQKWGCKKEHIIERIPGKKLKVSDGPTLKVVFNQWENGPEGLSYSELARVGLQRSAE